MASPFFSTPSVRGLEERALLSPLFAAGVPQYSRSLVGQVFFRGRILWVPFDPVPSLPLAGDLYGGDLLDMVSPPFCILLIHV